MINVTGLNYASSLHFRIFQLIFGTARSQRCTFSLALLFQINYHTLLCKNHDRAKRFVRTSRLAQLLRYCSRYGRPGVQFPGRSNQAQCRQRFATTTTFLRSCVAQDLSRGDEPATCYRLRRNNTSIMKI